jgi:hypothetical protein
MRARSYTALSIGAHALGMAGRPPAVAPSWRRLTAATLAVFGILLAFLAGRVQGGADPALRSSTPPAAQESPGTAPGATADPGLVPDDAAPVPAPSNAGPPATHAS